MIVVKDCGCRGGCGCECCCRCGGERGCRVSRCEACGGGAHDPVWVEDVQSEKGSGNRCVHGGEVVYPEWW